MTEPADQLFRDVELAQLSTAAASPLGKQIVALAGQMAQQLGATLVAEACFTDDDATEHERKRQQKAALGSSPQAWLLERRQRVALIATDDAGTAAIPLEGSVVIVQTAPQETEATLFAQSGLADLLGDPARAPLVPRGRFGAGTVAYAALAALAALVAKQRRGAPAEQAHVHGTGVLSWVNWKAAAAGHKGRDLCRQGDDAEWPILPCADGYVALVYQERDWPNMVTMVGDEALKDERFASFSSRETHRADYLAILRRWAKARTKHELQQAFTDYAIPAAAVMTPTDLLSDALLKHRNAFQSRAATSTRAAQTPRLAHRVAASFPIDAPVAPLAEQALPLTGYRVLDLGIITAGAGVSALLADLGAEVIKVEAHSYPDPFRRWAGQAVSPLFKCNNRNKLGLALDLKTPEGNAQFLKLVATADLVLENFRRGVLDRLGLGYEVLRQHNPKIILASISGQGLSGPGCGASSFGSTLEAASGFASNVSYSDGVPYITGRNVNYPDQVVVLYAAAVLTAALTLPQRGMHLDVSQRDAMVYLLGEELEALSQGLAGKSQDNGRCYRSADGQWIAVDAVDELPVAATEFGEWIKTQKGTEALATLTKAKVGAARVLRGSEVYERHTAAGDDVFATSPDGAMVKGFPFQLNNLPMTIRLNSPLVGEHSTKILRGN